MRCDCGHENDPSARQCVRCGAALSRRHTRLLIDLAAGAALLLALAVVFVVDRATGSGIAEPPPDERVTVTATEGDVAVNPLQIAVTPPEYDDMGRLLTSLGAGYRYKTLSMDDLLDAEKLAPYDVVFLTCGVAPDHWLGADRGATEREGMRRYTVRKEVVRKLHDSLRSYVGRGGTLYASDWHFDTLKIAFPEFIDASKAGSGTVQSVVADVVDPGLRRVVGNTIELNFDKPSWKPAAFKGTGLTVFLEGEYELAGGTRRRGPLLIQVPYKDGNLVFTSFHNEQQNTGVELELLRYLVFTTVTAKVDASVRGSLVRGGFSPVDRNLLSASKGAQSIARTYQSAGGRSLQFVLGFEDRGAELRLSIVGPDGRRFERSGASTFTIDVANAAAGPWQYTITPVKVPYQNFPFTLTVGEK